MKIRYFYRNNILELNFDELAGIGDLGFRNADEYYFSIGRYSKSNKSYKELIDLTEKINNCVYEVYGKRIDLNWTDSFTLEVINLENEDRSKEKILINQLTKLN